MSAALVHTRMPRIWLFADARRTVPKITLQRTATGWGLFDEHDVPVFEASGTGGRRACLQRVFAPARVGRAGRGPRQP
jgi:hypothetical protein